jgi:hypothetical protein
MMVPDPLAGGPGRIKTESGRTLNMKVVQETIDAKRAHELLDQAVRNGQKQRHLSEKRVAKFANAMLAGQWQLTHQAIAIDGQGVLIDGQHRLAAVVRSGTKQDFLVAYESEPATFDVIDTGQARTASDTLAIAGYTNVNVLSAAARMLLSYDDIKGTKNSLGSAATKYTSADILNFLESPRGETLMACVSEGSALAGVFGRYGAKTWLTAAVVVLMESDVHKDIAKEFLTKLRTGEMLAAGSPILAMRRWLMSDGGWVSNNHSQRNTIGIAVFIKTLNQWLAKDRKQVALFRVGTDIMPTIQQPENFLTAGTYGDDERTPLEIEETLVQQLEEANAS